MQTDNSALVAEIRGPIAEVEQLRASLYCCVMNITHEPATWVGRMFEGARLVSFLATKCSGINPLRKTRGEEKTFTKH